MYVYLLNYKMGNSNIAKIETINSETKYNFKQLTKRFLIEKGIIDDEKIPFDLTYQVMKKSNVEIYHVSELEL